MENIKNTTDESAEMQRNTTKKWCLVENHKKKG